MLSKNTWTIVVALLFFGLPVFGSSGHGPDYVELVARFLNVSIFAWILYFFLKQPVADFFVHRVSKIKEDLEMAKTSREEAEKRLAEIEEQMSGLDAELKEIAEKAHEEAEKEMVRLKKKAEEEALKIRQQAAKDIEQAKLEALLQLKRHVVDLAMSQVERTLSGKVSKEDHERLIQEFAEKLGA